MNIHTQRQTAAPHNLAVLTHSLTSNDFYANRAAEKNAAAELNPKHIWSKINSPWFLCTSTQTSNSPLSPSLSTQPWTSDKYSFFCIYVTEKKKSCDGQNWKASATKASCKHTHAHTNKRKRQTNCLQMIR